ncbi:hypothetical protein [Pedobacter sp. SYP-B3415]|uniref:YybH family protein n=1 Tax=Pedobacter sp. SYP-B3415 TaxID=2496641 RepID=UPI0019813A1C|nr:hypothetical protein [Pedobacter sp. SYP-B3415]
MNTLTSKQQQPKANNRSCRPGTVFLVVASLTALCCKLAACRHDTAEAGSSETHLEEAKRAIAASNALYFQSFVRNEPGIFIDRYAKDCCIMAPGLPAMCGQEAPLKFFRQAYEEAGLRNGRFITTGIYGNGKEYVTEEGRWQSFDKNGRLFDDGKFLVLWKKTPGGWKMFRDSFSSNRK